MALKMENVSFFCEPGFCANCGTILPLLGDSGQVKCFICKTEYGPEAFGTMESQYEIHFNSKNVYEPDKNEDGTEGSKGRAEGPVVERRCPKCGHDKMSYATLQLRSADEGQTVFYTCTKCRFKETENS